MLYKISYLFLFFALIAFGVGTYLTLQRYQIIPIPETFSDVTDMVIKPGSLPIRLEIPQSNINLPVITTKLEGNYWPATGKGISYLVSTALPGESGNAVFYGHNWPKLLGPLSKTQVGETLLISFADGSGQEYKINRVFTTSSRDISILEPTTDPVITLYTCTGLFDSKRLVVTAKPGNLLIPGI